MRLAKDCLRKLHFPGEYVLSKCLLTRIESPLIPFVTGYWANTSKLNLESFLRYRRKMCLGVTLTKDDERRNYVEDLKAINEHYGSSKLCIFKALDISGVSNFF